MKFFRRAFIITSFAAGMLPASHLPAQSISIDLDKKVIFSDSLNVPHQTNISTVLTLMSELLQRPGDVFYSNYDIKVNGMSVSDASDVALSQLDLQDVEKIEITESPISSYQKNGQGGSINLSLRKQTGQESSRWGSASVDLSYPVSVAPQLHLGYRSKKTYVSALALSDIYDNTNTSELLNFSQGELLNRFTTGFSERYRSQLANVLMEYTPTDRDLLKLNVSESYVYGNEISTVDYDDSSAKHYIYKSTTLTAAAAYVHNFSRFKLSMEANYRYVPGREHTQSPGMLDLMKQRNMHALGGNLLIETNLLGPKNPNLLNLAVGHNYNMTFTDEVIDSELFFDDGFGLPMNDRLTPENSTHYYQPFVQVVGRFGPFRMKVKGEFQHFCYNLSKKNEHFSTRSNDLTGQTILEWRFASGRTLRLFGARALQRPSENQLFPITLYSPADGIYTRGNADLSPVLTHELRLDYITDQRWGEHQMHYDVNVSYKHVHGMIESVIADQSREEGADAAEPMYSTYLNNGRNDIVSSNFLALYSYKIFSVALTGNLFHNKQYMLTENDHYTYFNVSLCPHFTLKDGWQGSFGLTYNSPVETSYRRLSDCTQTSTLIGKRWNNLYIYCFSKLALQKKAENITWVGSVRTVDFYEMIPNSAGIGVKYIW